MRAINASVGAQIHLHDLEAGDIMEAALRIGRAFFGAVRYADLRDMPVDEYLELIEEVNRQGKEDKDAT